MRKVDPMQRKIHEEAASWAVRMDGRVVTAAEAAVFAAWRAADPRHEAAYRAAMAGWRDIAVAGRSSAINALRGAPTWRERLVELKARLSHVLVPAPRGAIFIKAAAVASLALIVSPIVPKQFAGPVLETRLAEVRDITLEDGSIVTLGADSAIETAFTEKERRVTLVRGDAFFVVAKNPGRPFIVAAGNALARAVGTQFDVHKGSEEVRVAVLEGVVEVTAPSSMTPTLPEIRRLASGEEVVAPKRGALRNLKVASADIPGGWRTGRLTYDGVALREIIADINRYSSKQVKIDSDELSGLRVTTAFSVTEIEKMVDGLGDVLPLEADRKSNGEIHLRPKPQKGH